MHEIIAILALLIIFTSLNAYLLRTRKLDSNEVIIKFIEGFVKHPNQQSQKVPHDVENALTLLFKNLTTTYHLFTVLITHDGPLPEKDAQKIVNTQLSLKNKYISDAALKSSVRLLMASDLVAMDINEGYKPTPLGKELYNKLIS